ncbi:P-loop containing nucleoside triphosphate hydrolase protein [Amylocystis lapponica]|nr:P-loop containing nucleoside triphosphate hydrolase protein [Amylocystis lapponica]
MPSELAICPHQLYSGACTLDDCQLDHGAKFCDLCGIICSPASSFDSHARGKRHIERASFAAALASTSLKCYLCDVSVNGETNWSQHIAGAPHRKAAARYGVSPKIRPEDPNAVPAGHKRCTLCTRNIAKASWSSHLRGQYHLKLQRYANYKAAFEQAEKDKKGVTISHGDTGVDFGVVELTSSERGVRISLVVRTTEPSSRTTILQANVSATVVNVLCPFSATIEGGSRRLVYGQDTLVNVIFRHARRGRYEGRLELAFEDSSHKRFIIVRQIRAIAGNPVDHQQLKPEVPFTGRKRVPWKSGRRLLPGRRPPAIDAVKWIRTLPLVPVPDDVNAALRAKGTVEEITQYIREKILPATFDATTHGLHFKSLLWIEEYRMEQDLRIYDMADVTLSKRNSLYNLVVPGLAEKRPSVLVGDRVEIQSSAFDSDKSYEGWVHIVELNTVRLGFHASFNPTAGQHFNVRFKLNRVPLQRQHEALSAAPPSLPRLLFPTPAHAGLDRPATAADLPVTLYNQLLSSNLQQTQAVRSICQMRPGAAPFIVFGPPGTGKTVTVVEAILQILLKQPSACILACAPSNSAADIIAQRLMMLGKDKLFRFYAVSRGESQIPPELVPFTYTDQSGHFSHPAMDILSRYKVIVATCGSASFPYGIGMPAGHFSHIFVDEAGQASEAEVMTAIKTMLMPTTNVILSGDPKQLGPVIRSAVARELGFGVSYLERVMECEVYDLQNNRGKTIVKLVKNFRSHNAILSFPNESFYESELQTCGDVRVINSFVGSSVLVNSKFPVVFHAISGKDDRESSSPSYFNIDEIGECEEYMRMLLNDTRYPIAARDIGIIAPYQAQVRKLRQKLKNFASDCKVGSVEEFQGQERRAIIVSTVRSSQELMTFDAKYTLGFVSNPRRFNVAMTRAQALLIVVGDPSVLSIDPLWRSFLNYVHLNGGWRGDPITWDPRAPVQEGTYDAELRSMGAASASSFMLRVEEAEGEDMTEQDVAEGDANADMVFREAE